MKYKLNIQSANPTPRNLSKKNESVCLHRGIFEKFISALLITAQTIVETTQMSVNWWINKQSVVYLYTVLEY